MNLITFCLLIGISIIIIGETEAFPSEDELEAMVEDQTPLFSGPNGHLVLEYGSLGGNDYTLVWRGAYGNEKVAVKMVHSQAAFNHELSMYQALNAVNNPSVEANGIPNVYCYGSFNSWTMETIYFIAITMFDGTLESQFYTQRRARQAISDFSLSLIFKRSTEILEYIHSHNVIHNDIKPANIFLRGSEIFIADFDSAKFKGEFTSGSTPKFASLNRHLSQQRTEVDDLQSLMFSIWDVAGVTINHRQTYGGLLLESIQNGTLDDEITEKCQHFHYKFIKKTFQGICIGLFKNQIPDYSSISKTLNFATKKISKETGQRQFEWLSGASSS